MNNDKVNKFKQNLNHKNYLLDMHFFGKKIINFSISIKYHYPPTPGNKVAGIGFLFVAVLSGQDKQVVLKPFIQVEQE